MSEWREGIRGERIRKTSCLAKVYFALSFKNYRPPPARKGNIFFPGYIDNTLKNNIGDNIGLG